MSNAAFDKVVAALREKGCRVDFRGVGRAKATCPAHRDRNPSLGITANDKRVLVHCFAGCRTSDVLHAVGLMLKDLYCNPTPGSGRPRIVAVYPYCRIGVVAAEKVRYAPKAFKWRTPDPTSTTGYRDCLPAGVSLPLYREDELVGASRLLWLEGEKAVERARALGFAATCAPHSLTWRDEYAQRLRGAGCREVVVCADNDAPGLRYARQVVSALAPLTTSPDASARLSGRPGTDDATDRTARVALRPKLLTFAGLPVGGDLVDWLDAGHDGDDLRALIDATPLWDPGAEERERLMRRREKTRNRVKRWRELRRSRHRQQV